MIVTKVDFWLHRLGSHYIAEWKGDRWEFAVREWGGSTWCRVPSRPELLHHVADQLRRYSQKMRDSTLVLDHSHESAKAA
jgi:hypothetical protein